MINTQETETGTIPAEWDYEPLESFFDLITYGFTAPMPTVDEGPYMITAKDVNEGRIKYENARKTSKEAFDKILTNKSRPKVNDILITKDASIGRVAIVEKENLCINQSVALIRPNKRIRPLFLKYLLESPLYQKLIFRDASGSTILHIYITRINKMLIGVPSLDEQDGILGVIHTIQKKIDLLKAQNKTLETMAQTIFKEWFGKYQIGDELPEGWRVGKVGDLVNLKSGFSFKSKNFIENGNYKLVTIRNVKNGFFDKSTKDRLNELPKKLPDHCILKTGDILISLTGNVGRTCHVIGDNYLLNQRVCLADPILKEYFGLTYCLFRSKPIFKSMESISVGTAQLNLSPVQTQEICLVIPSSLILGQISKSINPLIKKLIVNNIQIESLSKTRDTLLPKLMSGQVRVNNIKQTANA
jgi:type I restriction enzyme S subunit